MNLQASTTSHLHRTFPSGETPSSFPAPRRVSEVWGINASKGNVIYTPITDASHPYDGCHFSTSPRSLLTSFSSQKDNKVTQGPLYSADPPKAGLFELSGVPHLCCQPGRPRYSILVHKGNRVDSNVEFSVLTLALSWFHAPYGHKSAPLKILKDLTLLLKFCNGLPSYEEVQTFTMPSKVLLRSFPRLLLCADK